MANEKQKISLTLSAAEIEVMNKSFNSIVMDAGFFPDANKSLNNNLANYFLGYFYGKTEVEKSNDYEITIEINLHFANSIKALLEVSLSSDPHNVLVEKIIKKISKILDKLLKVENDD